MITMRSIRRVPSILVVAGLIALLTMATPTPGSLPPDDLRGTPAVAGGQPQTVQGICDVDGIAVAYRSAYRSSPPLGYDVTDGVISGIAWPSCSGATLSVVVGDGSTTDRARGQLTLSASNVIVAGPSAVATVPLRLTAAPASPPDARWITTVGVTLDGGTTPVPPECAGMTFYSTFIGTNGDDVINGSSAKSDLIYSLEGADRIDGQQGADCVITGADAQGDTVVVGNSDNVVRTGAGPDVITAGNGVQRITSGSGNDTITVGTGKGSYLDAGPGTDTCRIPKSVKAADITVVGCEQRVAT
jgi:Ca2+-binding RTX toxin-like protein